MFKTLSSKYKLLPNKVFQKLSRWGRMINTGYSLYHHEIFLTPKKISLRWVPPGREGTDTFIQQQKTFCYGINYNTEPYNTVK